MSREPLRGRFGPLLGAVAISLLLRVPSLWDPPWVNDEGTYFAVAQVMSHDSRLYTDVWENKPPALYLLYLLVYRLAGPSLLSVRLLAFGAAVILILLVWRMAGLWVDEAHAIVAASVAGLILAIPFIEGTTANAEIFMTPLSAGAVYLALQTEWAAAAGVAAALAVSFKVVAGFDVAALALWLLFRRRHRLPSFGAGLVVTLAFMVVMAQLAGIFPGMLRDAYVYDLGYVGHANGGGIPWLLLLKILGLFAGTVAARRASFPYIWLLYAAAGSLVSGRLFGHYVVQLVAPLSLVIAMRTRGFQAVRLVSGLLAAYLSVACVSAGAGWFMAARGHDSILARRLQYYANFVRYASRLEGATAYFNQIDDHVVRNRRIATVLRTLPPGRLLIWGNVPWVYVLSDRMPATAYTSALRAPEVPGETRTLRLAVDRVHAKIVVVIDPPAPALGRSSTASLNARYRLRSRVGNARIYVAR